MKTIDLKPGVIVVAGNRRLEILPSKSISIFPARDISTGEVISIRAADIDFEIGREMSGSELTPKNIDRNITLLEDVGETEIMLAERRYEVLLPLKNKKMTKQESQFLAVDLGLSVSQLYRLIARLDVNSGFMSLLPQKRGRLKGEKQIASDAEEIIEEVIETDYVGKGATFQVVIEKVRDRCRELGIVAPSDGTITQRIKSKDPKELLKQVEGSKAASQAYEVRGGKILPLAPLELVQMDHALVDCIIVDSKERLPLGRPWATLAIDVFTRSVVGVHLSLAHPSSMSVALCIAHLVLPKDWWLKKYGIESIDYPFYGVPKRIHVDNAKEFKSQALKNSCRLYDIKLTYRPPAMPHNGAHIERLIGTLMKKVHLLPGTTMSSVKQRGKYDSQKHSALTFSEFREWFVNEIEIYHKKTHSELGCSPLLKWERHFLTSNGSFSYPPIIEDRVRLLIDFMPLKRRVIGRRGVRLHNIDYYSASLKYFNIGHRCIVRYDPESISKIWVMPEGETKYIELTYSDVRMPDTSLSEFNYARKKLAQDSDRRVTPEQVFALINRNENLVKNAVKQTKQVRKHRERKHQRQTDPAHPLNSGQPSSITSVSADYSRKPKLFDVED